MTVRLRPLLLGLLCLTSLLPAGCAHNGRDSTAKPHVVTAGQADLLARMRFTDYDRGGSRLTIAFPDGETLKGQLDWRRHRGTGTLEDASGSAPATLFWNPQHIAVRASDASGWSTAPLNPTQSLLHTALLLALNVAQNRPDNPQLLAQNGAIWERTTRLNGRRVNVMRGPTPPGGEGSASRQRIHYWVAQDALLYRMDVDLNPNVSPLKMVFTDHGPQQIEIPPELHMDE